MLMKKMLEIPLDAEMRCPDGKCGHLSGVILNPVSQEMTHVVLREEGLLSKEVLVPVELIASSASGVVLLNGSKQEIADLKPFHQTHFVRVDPLDYPHMADVTSGGFYEWPYARVEGDYALAVETESVPAHELAVHRGATMEATDGRIGHVDEFVVDPENNRISHLVLHQGHLWGKRDVVIPISAVDHVAGDTVYLTLDKDAVGALPSIPVRHGGTR